MQTLDSNAKRIILKLSMENDEENLSKILPPSSQEQKEESVDIRVKPSPVDSKEQREEIKIRLVNDRPGSSFYYAGGSHDSTNRYLNRTGLGIYPSVGDRVVFEILSESEVVARCYREYEDSWYSYETESHHSSRRQELIREEKLAVPPECAEEVKKLLEEIHQQQRKDTEALSQKAWATEMFHAINGIPAAVGKVLPGTLVVAYALPEWGETIVLLTREGAVSRDRVSALDASTKVTFLDKSLSPAQPVKFSTYGKGNYEGAIFLPEGGLMRRFFANKDGLLGEIKR